MIILIFFSPLLKTGETVCVTNTTKKQELWNPCLNESVVIAYVHLNAIRHLLLQVVHTRLLHGPGTLDSPDQQI